MDKRILLRGLGLLVRFRSPLVVRLRGFSCINVKVLTFNDYFSIFVCAIKYCSYLYSVIKNKLILTIMLTLSQAKRAGFTHLVIDKHNNIIDGFMTRRGADATSNRIAIKNGTYPNRPIVITTKQYERCNENKEE